MRTISSVLPVETQKPLELYLHFQYLFYIPDYWEFVRLIVLTRLMVFSFFQVFLQTGCANWLMALSGIDFLI